MSRFAHEHPDDYDSLIDAYRDEADTRRKETREDGGPRPEQESDLHGFGRLKDDPRSAACGFCGRYVGSPSLDCPSQASHPAREGSAGRRSDPVRSEDTSRHCPLCGSGDYTITGANRVVSIGIDWGARFHCDNCGASYR